MNVKITESSIPETWERIPIVISSVEEIIKEIQVFDAITNEWDFCYSLDKNIQRGLIIGGARFSKLIPKKGFNLSIEGLEKEDIDLIWQRLSRRGNENCATNEHVITKIVKTIEGWCIGNKT